MDVSNDEPFVEERAKWIYKVVSTVLDVPVLTVEKSARQSKERLGWVRGFVRGSGAVSLLWFYQSKAADDTNEPSTPQLYLTDGTEDILSGRCIYFVRLGGEIQTMSSSVVYGEIAANVWKHLKSTLNNVFLPALSAFQKQDAIWGELSFRDGDMKYLEHISNFARSLEDTVPESTVVHQFSPPVRIFEEVQSGAAIRSLATRPDIVTSLEASLEKWIHELVDINLGLTTAGYMRAAVQASGGIASDIDYWKRRMVSLNSITTQLSRPFVRNTVAILEEADCPGVSRWHNEYEHIVQGVTDARENLRYLKGLEQFMYSLGKSKPPQMIETIPALISAMSVISNISKHYATAENMTVMFSKITHVILTGCMAYLTEGGAVWSQEPSDMIMKMQTVIDVYEQYKACYSRARKKNTKHAQTFSLNESVIFRRFQKVKNRLLKLIDMMLSLQTYHNLKGRRVRGAEYATEMLGNLYNSFQKIQYDILSTDADDFDRDYIIYSNAVRVVSETFLKNISEVLDKQLTTQISLEYLAELNRLVTLPIIRNRLSEHFSLLFSKYLRDLERIRLNYEENKNDPPRPRNSSQVTGAMLWSRHLMRRITQPMQIFKSEQPELLQTKVGEEVMKRSEKLLDVFQQYEDTWHTAWVLACRAAQEGLKATVLILDPSGSGKLYVNFDDGITSFFREVRGMKNLDLFVPKWAEELAVRESNLIHYRKILGEVASMYNTIWDPVDPLLKDLLMPRVQRLNAILQPALQSITWQSNFIESLVADMKSHLSKTIDQFLRCRDVLTSRVRTGIECIRNLRLVSLSRMEMVTTEEFVEKIQALVDDVAPVLEVHNREIYASVNDLLDLALEGQDPYTDKERAEVSEASRLITKSIESETFDALLECVVESLKILRGRFRVSRFGFFGISFNKFKPVFRVELRLHVPEVVLKPSLDQIQECMNRAAASMIRGTKKIYKWPPSTESVFDDVAASMPVVVLCMFLSGSFNALTRQVQTYLDSYKRFEYLWNLDKQQTVDKFMEGKPPLHRIEEALETLNEKERGIISMDSQQTYGSLSLVSESLKYSLLAEAGQWKQLYGMHITRQSNIQMQIQKDRMEGFFTRLQRKVDDLVDVCDVMVTLSEIREMEDTFDADMGPIEEVFIMLRRYNVRFRKEYEDNLSSLLALFDSLVNASRQKTYEMLMQQRHFKRELVARQRAFDEATKEFKQNYDKRGPLVPNISPDLGHERLKVFKESYFDRLQQAKMLAQAEEIFGLPVTVYPEIDQVGREIELLLQVYEIYRELVVFQETANATQWVDVSIPKLKEDYSSFEKRYRKFPKEIRTWRVYTAMTDIVDGFNKRTNLLNLLKDPSIRPRHWTEVMNITGSQVPLNPEEFTLGALLSLDILAVREEIEEMTSNALNEYSIETRLSSIETSWPYRMLEFMTYRQRGEIMMNPRDVADIMADLENAQMLLVSLSRNRFVAPFKRQVNVWLQRLQTTADILELWMQVQILWVYLEAVFIGGDISKQLPRESRLFQQADRMWVKVMVVAAESKSVVHVCAKDETLKNTLPIILDQLQVCQKALSGFLEMKRSIFPRFCFVSDQILLEVLGEASDMKALESYMTTLFDNVVAIDSEYDRALKRHIISALHSADGETLPLAGYVYTSDQVENWLMDLVAEMRSTLNWTVASAVRYDDMVSNLEDFVLLFPAQVTCIAAQLLWTRDIEMALPPIGNGKSSMSVASRKCNLVLRKLIQMTVKELLPLDRSKVENLITVQIHQRDALEEVIKARPKSSSDFEWAKQVRFYFEEKDLRLVARITEVDIDYCYEYIGSPSKLVVTPLTDRCYITLAQAIGMYLGGAAAGPAGTGKTETTKDLGRMMGKYVIVFNCSSQMDYKGIGRIFKGLAMCGSWGCFDEFNRIGIDVLSVAAQQIASVLHAMREKCDETVFVDGTTISIDRGCGIFITMNPGYAGRHELPQNLKSLFRKTAMMVPDRRDIISVKLAACGFLDYRALAAKFFALYSLCEDLLSKQKHYDFGLRNTLSVLRMLGALRRQRVELSEQQVLMMALRDMNIPKLVDSDQLAFDQLLKDLFQGVELVADDKDELATQIRDCAHESMLCPSEDWVARALQLSGSLSVRHGVFMMGAGGLGKSCITRTVMEALSKIDGISRVMHRMNPKGITSTEMFGKLDMLTDEWSDGIFSALWRRISSRGAEESSWFVLDGPVDSEWIENLNTVLDDTRTLTLANNDRLPMPANMRVIFEVANLENASPATVSRAGVVFLGDETLGWEAILQSWVSNHEKSNPNKIAELRRVEKLVREHVPAVLDFMSNASTVITNEPLNRMRNLLRFIDSFILLEENSKKKSGAFIRATKKSSLKAILTMRQDEDGGIDEPALEGGGEQVTNNNVQRADVHTERLFIFSLCWGVGAVLKPDDRIKFSELLHTFGLDMPKISHRNTIFDFFITSFGSYQTWSSMIPSWSPPKDPLNCNASQLVVPTSDTVRMSKILKCGISMKNGIMMVGEAGSAKTVIMMSYLESLDYATTVVRSVNFSSATRTEHFSKLTDGFLEKRVGHKYGPPEGKTLMLFVDDINMPKYNRWGDQPVNELLRQVVEDRTMYRLEKPGDYKTIVDTIVLGAMVDPSVGRPDIPNRLKRHFILLRCDVPSIQSLDLIYNTILKSFFAVENGYSESVANAVPRAVSSILTTWRRMKERFPPNAMRPLYVYNLRDLTKITRGLMLADPKYVRDEVEFFRLVRHESMRTFHDKLQPSDREWAAECLKQSLTENITNGSTFRKLFAEEDTDYFTTFALDYHDDDDEPTTSGELFGDDGDLLSEASRLSDHQPTIRYAPSSLDVIKDALKKAELAYNQQKRVTKTSIVFTEVSDMRNANLSMRRLTFVSNQYTIAHIVRLCRILSLKGGHALLQGFTSFGKQTCGRLAGMLVGANVIEIIFSKRYLVSDFLNDVKDAYKHIATKQTPVVFLLKEQEILDEEIWEYINLILTTGYVPNLFLPEEIDVYMNDLHAGMVKAFPGMPENSETLSRYFHMLTKDHTHLVLMFERSGTHLFERTRTFPGLVSGTSIDVYDPWTEDALREVGRQLVSSVSRTFDDEYREDMLVRFFEGVHQISKATSLRLRADKVSFTYMSPAYFINMVRVFKNLYHSQHDKIINRKSRLETGLQRLSQATVEVDSMKVGLRAKEEEVVHSQEHCKETLLFISQRTLEAEEKKNRVAQTKSDLEEVAVEVTMEKAEAEEDLVKAKPALDAALAALDRINQPDLVTLRRLARPPLMARLVMDTVMILRHMPMNPVQQDESLIAEGKKCIVPSWDKAVKMLNDSNLLAALENYPKDSINPETCELLMPYLSQPDFNEQKARKTSAALAGLCGWVISMNEYHWVSESFQPKLLALQRAEHSLQLAQTNLQKGEDDLKEMQKSIDSMTEEYEETMSRKKALEEDAKKTRARMEYAEALIAGLSGERERWTQEVQNLENVLNCMVGDVSLMAAHITYSGPFFMNTRRELWDSFCELQKEMGIPKTPNVTLRSFMVDDRTVADWVMEGLPRDDTSIENGILVCNASRYPLLVDPQCQAKRWILAREKDNDIHVTNFNEKNFITHLEDCVAYGRPLLIEDAEHNIDLSLKNLFALHGSEYSSKRVRIGDRDIDFNSDFRLYVTSRFANPHFDPFVHASTAIVNFVVTRSGLEEQLLAHVVNHEKPELEMSSQAIIEGVIKDKKQSVQLGEQLLQRLASSDTNLLDDTELMDVLTNTKRLSQEIERRLKEAAETTKEIMLTRDLFRPVAIRGSILYFLGVEMASLGDSSSPMIGSMCHMYQTSLDQFLVMFSKALDAAPKAKSLLDRISNIIVHCSHQLYVYISQSLFSNHKLVFLLMLCVRVEMVQGKISEEEYEIFVKGKDSMKEYIKANHVKWLPDNVWDNLVALSRLEKFKEIIVAIGHPLHSDEWEEWYSSETPEKMPFPMPMEKLSGFDRLLLIRCLRKDRIILATRDYVSSSLGPSFAESVGVDLHNAWATCSSTLPILCVLSPGVDPSTQIEYLARKQRVNLTTVSLGQGQEIVARRLLTEGITNGGWILLQNCHLGLRFLTELERQLMPKFVDADPSFRLWLTSEPCKDFPISLLQGCYKVAMEAPQGVKAGLRRAYNWISTEDLDAVDGPHWRQILFSLCFLHTTIQERRKYGSVGWNKPYEFNHSDLEACTSFLKDYMFGLTSNEPISWRRIHFMIGEVFYGGHVTDWHDQRLLNNYVSMWISNAVFDRSFRFSEGYRVVDFSDLRRYHEYINTLPNVDRPEIFGLHPNAELAFNHNQTDRVLDAMLSVQAGVPSSGSESYDTVVRDSLIRISSACPAAFNLAKVKASLLPRNSNKQVSPMDMYLMQEVKMINKVILLVKGDVHSLMQAQDGHMMMTEYLEAMSDEVYAGNVPSAWLRQSWATASLGKWLESLSARTEQYAKWIYYMKPNSFWLAGLFNPEGLFLAMKQETSRIHEGWSLENMRILTDVWTLEYEDLEESMQPRHGILIHGLWLEGARWDIRQGRLMESNPKVFYSTMPVLNVVAVKIGEPNPGHYLAPVYRTTARSSTDYIFSVALATKEAASTWVLRGVALIASID